MPTVYLLGTGAAVTEPFRTTTMIALSENGEFLLVDCGGDAVQRLLSVGLAPAEMRGVILTHEHADHVGGFPLLMEKLWLHGRRSPLPVYGPSQALDQARRCFDTFDTSGWIGLPSIEWHEVDLADNAPVVALGDLRVTASPGVHGAPVIGLRAESGTRSSAVAYSCDTEPCASIEGLAKDVRILFHEATGERPGHSSARQAAEIARRSGAHRLVLVHLPDDLDDAELEDARTAFSATELGTELGVYRW